MKTKYKILIAKAARGLILAARSLAGKSLQTVVRRSGILWSLDLNEGIDLYIYLFGKFEPETASVLQCEIKQGNTVLDIGANIGAHLLPMAEFVGPAGKVYGFEPTKFAYEKATKNLALNPKLSDRVVLKQFLLTDGTLESPPEKIYSSWPLNGESGLDKQHCGALKPTDGAQCCSLDAWLTSVTLDSIDVIKLDVDGFEVQVLRGATMLLKRFQPLIVMELAPHVYTRPGESFEDLICLLSSLGYSLTDLHRKSLPLDAQFLRASIVDGGSVNVVAIPPTCQSLGQARTTSESLYQCVK